MLNKAEYSRIVTVSSLYHRAGKINFNNLNAERGYDPSVAYKQSKLANLLFTFEMSRRLKISNSQIFSLASHPGWSATELQRYKIGFRIMNPFFAQKSQQGALPTLYAATDSKIANGDYIGPDGFMEIWGGPKKVFASDKAKNRQTAEKLWLISENLTGIKFL